MHDGICKGCGTDVWVIAGPEVVTIAGDKPAVVHGAWHADCWRAFLTLVRHRDGLGLAAMASYLKGKR
jgi:hypothetical protein